MAAVLGERQATVMVSAATADVAFGLVADALGALGSESVVARCVRYRQRLDVIETKALAADVSAAGDDGVADKELRGVDNKSLSRGEKRKRAARAKAVSKKPSLGDRLEDGSLSAEQLDVLIGAANKSDGAALDDEDLIGQIAASGIDQGRAVVKIWVDERTRAADVNQRYERARRSRSVRRFTPGDGTAVIRIDGDEASIDEICKELGVTADALYRADGGRDIALGDHPRTHDQRMYDSLHALITGTGPNHNTDDPRAETDTGAGDGGRVTSRKSKRPQMVW